jgi:hypothetical protein
MYSTVIFILIYHHHKPIGLSYNYGDITYVIYTDGVQHGKFQFDQNTRRQQVLV